MIETTVTATGEVWLLLEPKDLRIGNALMYKGQFVYVTMLSLDIDDEYQEMIGFCEWGKTSNEIADWNRAMPELKPIPLTAQILEKCGFSYEDQKYYHKKVNPIFPIMNGKYDMIGLPTKNKTFQYLHQLQNLYFALTGEELIINL